MHDIKELKWNDVDDVSKSNLNVIEKVKIVIFYQFIWFEDDN